MNPWMSTFEWYWFNDERVFRYTQEDFDREALRLRDDKITFIATFWPAHFRWNFMPYWDILNAALRKLVIACHKYGIKVVEHHSARLTFGPQNEEDWEYMARFIGKKGTTIDSWEGLREFTVSDPIIIDDKTASSMRQIDGRTGQWARSNYHGWSMCFNNPDFVRAYFASLEAIYETGVDGIMTDDVQNTEHACTCPSCRRLFKEETGYELPDPEHWDAFFENYEDPAYVAWKRFRVRSNDRFQQKVNEHFEGLGLKLLRPNYISEIVYANKTAYPFEHCAHLWDYIFQENVNKSIIGTDNMRFMIEAQHRYAMARPYGVPTMSMFYPETTGELYLAWALARAYGQIYTGSTSGASQPDWERPFRAFERKHEFAYTAPEKKADVAFYHSTNTRDFVFRGLYYIRRMTSRMQGCYQSGVQIDLVFPHTSLDILKTMPCIALCDAVMLSEEEIGKLKEYLHAGGRIIIEGLCGTLNADGTPRDYSVTEALSAAGDVRIAPTSEIRTQDGVGIGRYEGMVPFKPAPENQLDAIKALAAQTIFPHLKTRRVLAETSANIAYTFFRNESGYILHLYNNEDLVPAEGTHVTRCWQYPNYEKGAPRIGDEIALTIERCDERKISSVTLASPEWEEEKTVPFTDDGKHIRFTVPADTFSGYLLVNCR